MSEKLSDFVGNVKYERCGRKFHKGKKGERPSCPGCGGKLLLKEIDDTRLLND